VTPRRQAVGVLRTVSVWALVVFHAALFVRRLAEPGALDAAASVRWAGTFVVFATAYLLRAWAARLTRRQLLALALAAVALHAPMLQGPAESERALAFWTALPALLAPALALCGLASACSLVRAPAAALAVSPLARVAQLARTPFSPRPPPLL
jgi:hypothetical protein